MNNSTNRIFFKPIGEIEIARFIEQAERTLIIAIPSLTECIAEGILACKAASQHIVLAETDSTEHRSTEHAPAVLQLLESGRLIRVSDQFAIGALVVDERGWIFSPLPKGVSIVNSYNVSSEDVKTLVSGLSATLVKGPVAHEQQPELGEKVMQSEAFIEEVKKEQKAIEQKEERKKVLDADFEFVEIELRGSKIARKTIAIPDDLASLGMSKSVQDILSSQAKLFTKDHKFTEQLTQLEEKRKELKANYLIEIPNFGLLIRRHMKKEFVDGMESLQELAADVKNQITAQVQGEVDKTRAALVKYYAPMVKKNPPVHLKKISPVINAETVKSYLEDRFKDIVPDAKKLFENLVVSHQFKGITVELLNDMKFVEALERKGVML